jgi:sugar phosphate isomerase/epimerase
LTEKKYRNTIASRPASYRKFSDLAFEYLPKAGIYNVEIAPPAPDEVNEKIRELEEHGLTATSLATGVELSDEASVRDLITALDTARRMDAAIVFCSTRTGELERQRAYEKLREIGEDAQEAGAVVSMETHPNMCQNSEQMLDTMRGVDHPGIRINFDTANIYYYNQGVDGVEELRKVRDYVASVHLKDTNGGYREHHFPTLGEGVVDFPSVFRVLNDVGFRGPFTFEMEGIAGEDLTLEESHKRIVDSMKYLNSIGVL